MTHIERIDKKTETLDKIRALVFEDKLLDAHLRLSDLDRSREDLVVSICSLGPSSQAEVDYVFAYFSGVDEVYELLAKKLWLVVSRTINAVRQQPSVIVSAVRIIEREERSDQIAYQRTGEELSRKAGRPRRWRAKCFDILGESVQDRIDGCQVESREEQKMWLVRHLEMMRLNIVDDLITIKSQMTNCFPPSYDIDVFMCRRYHLLLGRHLRGLLGQAAAGNEATHLPSPDDADATPLLTEEIVTILGWIDEYEGASCLSDPRINLRVDELGERLLDEATIESLRRRFTHGTSEIIREWMHNAVQKELDDWREDKESEKRHIGYVDQAVFTSITQTVVQIIDQNVRIAERVNCGDDVFEAALGCLSVFLSNYGSVLNEYHQSSFANRLQLKHYAQHLMAVANNSCDLSDVVRKWMSPEPSERVNKRLIECLRECEQLRQLAVKAVLAEPFEDLRDHLRDFGTPQWLRAPEQSEAIQTLCATMEDYSVDYRRSLIERNYDFCFDYVQKYVLQQLLGNLLERRIRCQSESERHDLAHRLRDDFQLTMSSCFEKLAPSSAEHHAPNYEALGLFAELLTSSADMLGMVAPNLMRFGGATEQQVARLVDVRGDLRFDFNNLSRYDGPRLMLDVGAQQLAAGDQSRRGDIFDELAYRR